MKLKVKDLEISTGATPVVTLNNCDAKLLDLYPLDRILVKKNSRKMVAVLDIAESEKAVPHGTMGFFEEALNKLGVKSHDVVEVSLAKKPESIDYIKKKLSGKELNYDESLQIINDIVDDKLTQIEMTAYVLANYANGMTQKEIVDLTKAMSATGSRLNLDRTKGPIVDLHSIGGVPGNRTTLIIIPIVVAAGLRIPKTSSRAITSPAGTADTMEVLCSVSATVPKLKRIINKVGGFIMWGGAVNLSPADDKIIKIESPLSIDAEGQMLASIMSKKYSVGSTHLLMEIPIGEGTKIKTVKHAKKLEKYFKLLGKELGINVEIIIEDGTQPVGRGIGPALEARDCLWVLKNDKRGSSYLRYKSLKYAGRIFEMCGKASKGKGFAMAEKILESGKAYKKMVEIINAQGGEIIVDPDKVPLGEHQHDCVAQKDGVIKELDNFAVAHICRILGCPRDKQAGIYLHKHENARIKKGDLLFTLYSESEQKLRFAVDELKRTPPFIF